MDSSRRLDRILFFSAIGLAIVVVGVAGFFGWTVYRDRAVAEGNVPAMRVVVSLEQATRKNPNDSALRVRLGEAYAAAGKTQKAIEQFNAALKIDPKNTSAFLDLGQVAIQNGRTAEGEGYFQKVVDLTAGADFEGVNDKREIALFQMGRIALSQKDYPKAIAQFKGALRIRKDASDTYYWLARALDGMGQSDEAKRQLEIALTFDPNFAVARYFYGELFMRSGDKVSASYQFSRAAQADPNAEEPRVALEQFGDPATLVQDARAKMAADPSAALDLATIAANIDPNLAEGLKLKAQILAAMGQKPAALDAYTQASKIATGDPEIMAAIKALTPPPVPPKKKIK
ncbi:MAG: tetratricopeptide repeat protein [Coriobacteriia bacterium]